jgi:hypothetical protein
MSALIEGGIEANFLRYFGIGIFGGYGLALSKTYEVGGSARLSFAHLSLLEDSLIPSSVFSGIAFSLVVDGFYYSYIEGTPSGSTFPPSYFEFRYGASMMTRFRKLPLIINSTIQITRLNLSMLVSPSISMGWLF